MSATTSSPSLIKRIAAQREYGVLALLVITVAIVAGNDRTFLDFENVRNMLVSAAPYIIIGCGLTLVIVTGEIDISVGSSVGLLAAIMGLLTSSEHSFHWPVP